MTDVLPDLFQVLAMERDEIAEEFDVATTRRMFVRRAVPGHRPRVCTEASKSPEKRRIIA